VITPFPLKLQWAFLSGSLENDRQVGVRTETEPNNTYDSITSTD